MRRLIVLLTMVVLAALPVLAQDEGGDHESSEGGDVVHFGSDVRIPAGQNARDIVCFLCSVQVDGTVHRDIVVFLGSVHVNGTAGHDIVVFAGNVSIADHASVGHDIVIMGGQRHAGSDSFIGHDSVIFPPIVIALPLILLVGGILLIVRFVRWLVDRNRPIYGQPY